MQFSSGRERVGMRVWNEGYGRVDGLIVSDAGTQHASFHFLLRDPLRLVLQVRQKLVWAYSAVEDIFQGKLIAYIRGRRPLHDSVLRDLNFIHSSFIILTLRHLPVLHLYLFTNNFLLLLTPTST